MKKTFQRRLRKTTPQDELFRNEASRDSHRWASFRRNTSSIWQ